MSNDKGEVRPIEKAQAFFVLILLAFALVTVVLLRSEFRMQATFGFNISPRSAPAAPPQKQTFETGTILKSQIGDSWLTTESL